MLARYAFRKLPAWEAAITDWQAPVLDDPTVPAFYKAREGGARGATAVRNAMGSSYLTFLWCVGAAAHAVQRAVLHDGRRHHLDGQQGGAAHRRRPGGAEGRSVSQSRPPLTHSTTHDREGG